MNNDERKVFWERLCSLIDDNASIDDVIKYPRYIYRYRSLSIKSLEDIKNNRLTFSTSNYYDDPFDTYLIINRDKLKNDIKNIFEEKNIAEFVKNFFNVLDIKITEEEILNKIKDLNLDKFCQNVLRIMKENSRNVLRSYTLSACFSESGLNESLWLKYADQHKGFVIIYDPYDETKYLCGKQDKCKRCSLSNQTTSLYPIYYSDEPYDATEYAKWFTAFLILNEFTSETIANDIILSVFPKMSWEREKITLIKKKCHMYDQEWRIISSVWNNKPITIEWKPYGIILGLNMPSEDKDLVYHNAKLAGIKNIYECYIDDNDTLNYRIYRK